MLQWGTDTAPTVTWLSRPCSGIMALVGAGGCYSHSKLCHLCHLAFAPTHSIPYLYTVAKIILMPEFHEKTIKIGKNQPLFICQVSCTKANR